MFNVDASRFLSSVLWIVVLLLLGVFFVADVSMLLSSLLLLFSCVLDIGMSGDVDSDARLSKDDDDDLEASPFASETLRETRAFFPAPDAFFAECARYVVNAGETGSRFSWSSKTRLLFPDELSILSMSMEAR